MRYFFEFLIFVSVGATSVFAYELKVTEIEKPYDIVPIEIIPIKQQVFLNKLNNFPVMYEIIATEAFVLNAQLSQLYQSSAKPLKLSLMIIKVAENGRGVTEVARFNPGADEWVIRRDFGLGITFWESVALSRVVEPGVYRIEVSTPENIGRYRLTLGTEEDSVGYFAKLGQVGTTQKFFGYSSLRTLTSAYVYYPLGILVLIFTFYKVQRYRKSE